MTKNTRKQKILLTLIFLVPFALLVTNNPIIETLLVIYAGYFIYLVIDKDIVHLELPEVGYPEPIKTKQTESELPGLSNVRQAEQNIHNELNKSIAKKLVKKPTIKKVNKKQEEK